MTRSTFKNLFKILACIFVLTNLLLVGTDELQAQYSNVTPPPTELATGFESINIEQSKEWLGVLAGPKFEGRGTGQPGYTKAAHWIAGKVAEFGLEPIGDNGTYFQMLPMKRRVPVMDECFIAGQGFEIRGDQFGLERFTDQQETTGEVVFVNFNGAKAQIAADANLRDKIVVYATDAAAARTAPRQLAQQRPAAALRIITGKPNSISQFIRPGRRTRSTSVSGTITVEGAKALALGLGADAEWVDAQVAMWNASDQTAKTPIVKVSPTQRQANLRMRFQEEQAAVPNVVAWLEGSDPKLKHEYVVLGSHLDHLGIRGGQVYPGADDNGSGSTAVLNIAKAFSENKTRPKRSVLFIWFAAEEIGLVGSKHYCNNPTKPLKDMICMFNIDMVGRNEETKDETSAENEGSIHIVGSQKGETDIHSIVLEANKHVGFRFELDEEGVWNRSDQINFFEEGVPVAFLFGGFHPDYHQPSDKVGEINFKKLVSAAKLYYMAVNLASDHGPFKMKSQSQSRRR